MGVWAGDSFYSGSRYSYVFAISNDFQTQKFYGSYRKSSHKTSTVENFIAKEKSKKGSLVSLDYTLFESN